MTHPRTLIREDLGRELVRRGAWADAVFVDRATPIEEEDVWPNVCVYTQTDRTSEFLTNAARRQELSLLVEVRAKRPNGVHQAAAIEGMHHHPAQTGKASRLLDDACEVIEKIVFERYNNRTVELEGQTLIFDPISEINTDLSRNAEGEVPHVMAQIEFKLLYTACFPPLPPQTCPLEFVWGEINHVTCNPADPLNGKRSVGLSAQTPQPELGTC